MTVSFLPHVVLSVPRAEVLRCDPLTEFSAAQNTPVLERDPTLQDFD